MNWKINYWTLIAAIMAGSFLYSCMDTNAEAKSKWKKEITNIDQNVNKVLDLLKVETECDATNLTIPASEAVARMTAFMGKTGEIKRGLGKKDTMLPDNLLGSIIMMKLPKCETLEMFEAAPEGETYLYLTVEKDTTSANKDATMVSAIFSTSNFVKLNGEFDKAKAKAGGATFFDFITPCPPACGGNG